MVRETGVHLARRRRLPRARSVCATAGLLVAVSTAAAAQVQVPETHTVRKGDTLWDLAKYYLKDPFLWPEIYRLNTAVVEDPHWIYPGEVLRLAPSAAVSAVPETDTPAPPAPGGGEPPAGSSDSVEVRRGLAEAPVEPAADTAAPAPGPESGAAGESEHLFPPAVGQRVRQVFTVGPEQQPHPLRRGDFYSSGFLTEGERLPFGRVLGSVVPPQIESSTGHTAATLYSRIAVEPPAGGSYQVGDTLLVADVSRRIEGYGRVVEPTALGRVVEIAAGAPIVELVAVYGAVLKNQAVLPAERFTDPGAVRPVPVSDGLEARVVGWPGQQVLAGNARVLFLDKGKQDGVAAGDVFELRRTARRRPDGSVTTADPVATVQVVHVRERTATARVLGVSSADIPPGTRAQQVAKLPT